MSAARELRSWVHRVDLARNRALMVSIYPGHKVCARIWGLPLTARFSPILFAAARQKAKP